MLFAQQASLARYFNDIVAIKNNTNEKGMGFIISRFTKTPKETYYYVATAKHVIGQSPTVQVYYDKVSSPVVGKVVLTSEEFDVALLQVPTSGFDWTPIPYLIDSRVNDPLWFTIKTTSERRILPIEGAEGYILTSASSEQLIAQLTGVDRGCSGGPLIGKKGIVGMITDLLIDGQTVALPIKTVWQLVKKEWGVAWDLPIAERVMEKSSISNGVEQEINIVNAHATFSDINRRLMIDGDTDTYWYSRTAPSNYVKTSLIDLFLEKPTKVTAIAVFIPRNTRYKHFDLISEGFGQEEIRVSFGRNEPVGQYETRRVKYAVLKTVLEGTWYVCRFSHPTHATRTVTFTLLVGGDDKYRQNGRVNEVKIWGEPVVEKGHIEDDQFEQIDLINSTVTRVNGDPKQGRYLTDGILDNAVNLNLNDSKRLKQESTIEVELPESYAITHLRIHAIGNNTYGSIRILQPYYDGLSGKEIILEGKYGWEQISLQPGIQARSLKFVIKEGWDTYGDQQTIQLNEIQLLGRRLLK